MEASQIKYRMGIADRGYREIYIKPSEMAKEIQFSGIIPKVNSAAERDIIFETGILQSGDTTGIAVPLTAAAEILAEVRERARMINLEHTLAYPQHAALAESAIIIEPEAHGISSSIGFEYHINFMRNLVPRALFWRSIKDSFALNSKGKYERDDEKHNDAWEKLVSSGAELTRVLESIQKHEISNGAMFPIGLTRSIHPDFPESLEHAALLSKENQSISSALGKRKICPIAISSPALRSRSMIKELIEMVMKRDEFGQPEIMHFEFDDCNINGDTGQFRNFRLLLEMTKKLRELDIPTTIGGSNIALSVALGACGVTASTAHIGGRTGFRQKSGGGARKGNGFDFSELDWVPVDVIDDYIDENGVYPAYTPSALSIAGRRISELSNLEWIKLRKKIGTECIDELNRLARNAASSNEHLEGVTKRLWDSKHANLCKLIPGYNGEMPTGLM